MTSDPYLDRIMVVRDLARQIAALCESYQRAPAGREINRLLISVERLADIAETIEVDRTNRALDA